MELREHPGTGTMRMPVTSRIVPIEGSRSAGRSYVQLRPQPSAIGGQSAWAMPMATSPSFSVLPVQCSGGQRFQRTGTAGRRFTLGFQWYGHHLVVLPCPKSRVRDGGEWGRNQEWPFEGRIRPAASASWRARRLAGRRGAGVSASGKMTVMRC